MQQISTINKATTSVYTAAGTTSYTRQVRTVAGSRSLASMLPSLLSTGFITFFCTGILQLLWDAQQPELARHWMEAWLTSWPIAFPLTYLSLPLIRTLMHKLSMSHHQEN
ncbi:DUF2798 domain-containing protein [Undibacterium rugosum]|uniref:DUF2798 domain-containing protein n=1 Tax=Undibacterium rugosum TaxID=2762291 RepID=A0A923I5L9_9BURK|nr:DUF2798 domain-containing protein [Undibacterium rugosum]MBC3934003.1 DUF2798 domain-containing protein [Undibacterium rugosum]MBR7777713.1 DUF2798 domain-containing protein [Undibacterium rugosum]